MYTRATSTRTRREARVARGFLCVAPGIIGSLYLQSSKVDRQGYLPEVRRHCERPEQNGVQNQHGAHSHGRQTHWYSVVLYAANVYGWVFPFSLLPWREKACRPYPIGSKHGERASGAAVRSLPGGETRKVLSVVLLCGRPTTVGKSK